MRTLSRRGADLRPALCAVYDGGEIAGEDDLDTLPDITNDAGEGHQSVVADIAVPSATAAPPPTNQPRPGNGANPPVREKLSAEESASIRAQLVREIETLPQDDLQPRAIAILKAKNRLSTNDAKQVEDAFAARMAQQEPSVEALTPDEPTSAQAGLISPRPFLGPPEAVKRPRGRPRKTKAVIERAAGVASAPKVDDDPNMRVAKEPSNAPTRDLNATSVIKIDKSMLNFAEPRRVRDKTHLRFVALQPCLVCGRSPSDPHHLRFAQPRALGRKTSDEFVVPLCRTHHRLNHQVGDEVAWWRSSGIDPVQVANRLWGISRGVVDKTR